ncbi:hypothetical protein PANDA_006827, partial [Ailuropoda melanoleuca]
SLPLPFQSLLESGDVNWMGNQGILF